MRRTPAGPGLTMTVEIAGKYQLLRKLATGGMAEVFLARQKGPEGFEKLVVIKRILPHLAEEREFVKLFLDEARTAADLRHPNVVNVFDVGEDHGTWYLAMEYLHGQNLRRIGRAAAEQGASIPLALGCHVLIEAARGLHHAHTKSDLRGAALGIVHRDVSPHNILVSYDGVAKIVDFGIAKAAGKTTQTASGIVRGKVAYMSPEQAKGMEIDARSDQFALGTVLWEITTGQRLFEKESDILIMQAVADADVTTPSSVVPGYPEALERIVLKALAARPADRYPSCGDLADALEEWLAESRLVHSASRLSTWLKDLFGEAARESLLAAGATDPHAPEIPTLSPALSSSRDAPTNRVEGALFVSPGSPPRRDAASAPAASLTSMVAAAVRDRRTNLGADPSPFVGRVADLDALTGLFSRGERLVTLTGPGGSGKTRLARRFGATELSRGGQVWFCDLTDATSVEGICATMGAVLGLPLKGGADIAAELGPAIAGRGPALLILDNFEQVVSYAEKTLARWMAAAPEARFLVTSRELLAVGGEIAFELGALPVPSPGATGEEAAASDAVQLFLQRGRAVKRDFALGNEVSAVAEIVRRLEGMPLAIELAAARVGVLSPTQLKDRLAKSLDLLAAGPRGGSGRHSTLRSTIEWSWNLLSRAEQSALAQCAVFKGGFTLDAAEAIVDLSEVEAAPPVMDAIQSLKAKSLLKSWEPPEMPGEIRLGMYSNIASFAAEKLKEAGFAREVEARHAAWYLDRGAGWAAEVEGKEGLSRLERLALEMENLLAVLAGALATQPVSRASATRALKAVEVMDPVLSTRGPFETHLGLLDRTLALADQVEGVPKALFAEVLGQRGWTRRRRGMPAEALADLEQAAKLAREAGDQALEARLTCRIGSTEVGHGRREAGLACLEQARDAFLALGDKRGEGYALYYLGAAYAGLGRHEDARSCYVKGLAIQRERGDRRREGMLLRSLGALLHAEGKLEEAREALSRALPIAREFRDKDFEGLVAGTLAGICHEQGRFEEAREHFQRALSIHGEVGKRHTQAIWLGNLGILEHEQGRLREAADCYRAAAEKSRAMADKLSEALYTGYLAAATADLDERGAAEKHFLAAARLLDVAKDELPRRALATLEGHLDVAHARAAARAGDDAKADSWQAVAMKRIQVATSPGDQGIPSPAERSEDVRHALRLLRTALQSAMGTTWKLKRKAKPSARA